MQVGRDATVHIWDGDKCEVISILKGQHERGVCTVDFSGKRLCAFFWIFVAYVLKKVEFSYWMRRDLRYAMYEYVHLEPWHIMAELSVLSISSCASTTYPDDW